jgi:hypothetical protein
MKTLLLSLAIATTLAACGAEGGVYNLDVDEAKRAQVNAAAYFNGEHPAGVDAAGNLTKKQGSFTACRPQDSNANGMVTCTGMVPDLKGGFIQQTRYCGYRSGNNAVLSCSDKDQM